VFAHYRIGPLGFAAHPGFGTGNGNWGLADGIEALKWTRDNIMYFGGDAGRVTIQGSSAGGAYTMMILASPLSVGLVHNVIAMSPYSCYEAAFFSKTANQQISQAYAWAFCDAPMEPPAVGSAEAASQAACLMTFADFYDGRTDDQTMNDAGYFWTSQPYHPHDHPTPEKHPAVNITDPNGLHPSEVANHTAERVNRMLTAFEDHYNTPGLYSAFAGYLPWNSYPNVDGTVLDMDPLSSYRTGRNKAVTVVIGHSANEYSMLFSMPGAIQSTSIANHQFILGLKTLDTTATIMDAWNAAQAAPTIDTVNAAVYSDFANGDFTGYTKNIQSAVDVWFTRGIDESVKALMAGGSSKVYRVLHQFGVPSTPLSYLGGTGALLGAYHAGEDTANMGYYAFGSDVIGAAFGMYAYGGMPWSAAETQMGEAYVYYWKNVFMTGNPNGGDSQYPDWPANSDATMVFSPAFAAGASVGSGIRHYPCVAESSMGYRSTQLAYFNDPTATPTPMPGCVDGDAPYVSDGASGAVTGTFGLTMPDFPFLTYNVSGAYSCSTCSCTSPSRKTLFGAPTTSSATCSCVDA
jgi:carboxylesterase type B